MTNEPLADVDASADGGAGSVDVGEADSDDISVELSTREVERRGEGLYVVGIGASAGGIEALRELLPVGDEHKTPTRRVGLVINVNGMCSTAESAGQDGA